MSGQAEFEEIGHTGGKVTFRVLTDPEGQTTYRVGWTHARPTPAAIFGVYAIPQGVAVGDIEMRGMGVPWNPSPIPGSYPVLIASDSSGMFGRQCPNCNGYWRTRELGKICPYCGLEAHQFYELLTEAQHRYVNQYCDYLRAALHSGADGEYAIDMDAVADAVGKSSPRPEFYYAEERQQNLFTCVACGGVNDVLGTYAYCSRCGTRNDLQELRTTLERLRIRINTGDPYEHAVRDSVAAFDSFATQLTGQLLARVPLTRARRSRLERVRFHNLRVAWELFRDTFDIDILDSLAADDISFLTLMFHRRHVYEHKGGEADEKYIVDSGDDVRLKQALRESRESAHRTVSLVEKLGAKLHEGFHDLFPPVEDPIREHRRRSGQQRA